MATAAARTVPATLTVGRSGRGAVVMLGRGQGRGVASRLVVGGCILEMGGVESLVPVVGEVRVKWRQEVTTGMFLIENCRRSGSSLSSGCLSIADGLGKAGG